MWVGVYHMVSMAILQYFPKDNHTYLMQPMFFDMRNDMV